MLGSRMRPHISRYRRQRRRPWLAAALLVGGSYVAAIALAGLAARPRMADLAVVFGNTVGADGQPSPRLRARLDTALALYRRGSVRRILVSGGVEQPGDRDEARCMAAYLESRGVPASAVTRDAAGVDTFETARHTAALAAGNPVVVVTQWFHIPRAMLAMRRFGLRDVSGDWPRWAEARDPYSFLREALAIPYYAVRTAGGPDARAIPPAGAPRPQP